jgi:hypothetical protein
MAMNRLQYLLGKLAEECNEVGQRCSKAMQFGLDEVQELQHLTNKERLELEFNDILVIALLLHDEFGFNNRRLTSSYIEVKKAKIEKYYLYSKSLGMVE